MLMHWHIAQLVLKQGISKTKDSSRRKLSTQLQPCRLRMTRVTFAFYFLFDKFNYMNYIVYSNYYDK